jgi:hypothetical protein
MPKDGSECKNSPHLDPVSQSVCANKRSFFSKIKCSSSSVPDLLTVSGVIHLIDFFFVDAADHESGVNITYMIKNFRRCWINFGRIMAIFYSDRFTT